MKPFLDYLDNNRFKLANKPDSYYGKLTSPVRLWEQGQGGPAYRRLRDLESAIRDQKELFEKPDLKLVYRQKIQAFSPLLYCKQIQLRCTEFDVKEDELLVVNLQAYNREFRSLVKPIIGNFDLW